MSQFKDKYQYKILVINLFYLMNYIIYIFVLHFSTRSNNPSFLSDAIGILFFYVIFFLVPFWLVLKFLVRYQFYGIYKIIIASIIAFNIPLFGVQWLFAGGSYGQAMKAIYTYNETFFNFPYRSFQIFTLPIYSILLILILKYIYQFKTCKKK